MPAPRAPVTWRDDPARVRPMLATTVDDPSRVDLADPGVLYEPKLDGIRALILLEPAQPSPRVTIWSRLGNEKTAQFPEVVRGLKDFGKRLRVPVLLDGEIVALHADGQPAGFQRLQGRMHLTGARDIARQADAQAAAFIAFDLLRDGAEDLRPMALTDRKARLERLFGASGSSTVRYGDYVAGDGRRLYQQAQARGWEGLIVKAADSPYETGRRSRAWRKVKLVKQQEFVVGGWTDPRETRLHFGALLLGVYEPGGDRLRYVGHSGTGFTDQELGRVFRLLKARATEVCPFVGRPASNERPHWVRPELIAQVRFTEWTDEGLLRHPVYLGLRDDVDPKQVRIEAAPMSPAPTMGAASAAFDPASTEAVSARERIDAVSMSPSAAMGAAFDRASSDAAFGRDRMASGGADPDPAASRTPRAAASPRSPSTSASGATSRTPSNAAEAAAPRLPSAVVAASARRPTPSNPGEAAASRPPSAAVAASVRRSSSRSRAVGPADASASTDAPDTFPDGKRTSSRGKAAAGTRTVARRGKASGDQDQESGKAKGSAASGTGSGRKPGAGGSSGAAAARRGTGRIAGTVAEERALLQVVDQLQALEDARRDGTIALPDGTSVDVTNLAKVFWPTEKLTKGDLLRYYVRVSPWLLPAVADRPLVMKRFPNGITAKAFYQQRAFQQGSSEGVPPGVRVEQVEDDSEEGGLMPRIVGGSLATLLYTTQLAAISQDPWFSRVQSPGYADYVALDLDPMPGVPFAQVLDVARWVHEELEALHIPAVPKTSGASGLHVYIPLPPRTTYESGQLLCHIVATMVAMKHGRVATVERAVAKRGRKVYVDYLQNIEGKTLATAYSARASEFAGVSTPLTWEEIHAGLEPQDFTMRTVLPRFERVGDLWAPIRTARPVDLRGTLERLAAGSS